MSQTQPPTSALTTSTTSDANAPHLLWTIDPGTNSLGYAIFLDGTPKVWGAVQEGSKLKHLAHQFRMMAVWLELKERIIPFVQLGCQFTIVIEAQEHFGSYKSDAASSDISKLRYTTAFIAGAIFELTHTLPHFVKPREWKGQKKKEHTAAEVLEAYNISHPIADVIDAIGIGQAYLEGKFKVPVLEHR